MAVNTLREKFLGQLPFVYYSEHKFIEAQGKMMAQATDPTLKASLEQHIQETKMHASNLEQVFTLMGHKPVEKECPICVGLIKSGENSMKEAANEAVRDVAIDGAIMLVEHYEIAAYRGLSAQAAALNRDDIVQLLRQNLQQEEACAEQAEAAAPTLMQKVL